MDGDCNNKFVRVRFAPSPTGHLHIGSVRTGLFNWLFARHHKGTFLIRIEDTDIERSTKEYADSILLSLAWLGLTSDEPVVFQSAFIDRHRSYIEKLLGEGKAYKCYCASEEAEKGLSRVKYDQHCRTCTSPAGNKSYVVRFRLPNDRDSVTFHDAILGDITIPMEQLDDFIIARSDGSPIYNFVVVVDDAMMRISHVIRGQDHIDNTSKQILLYEALGFEVPQFAHIPLILGESGHRLSKRDAATSVLSYKEEGYIPEALINYLARLGWAHGDQELFSIEELIRDFSLEEVGKSNATFDLEKLCWVNSEHIKQKSAPWLFDYIIRELDHDFPKQLTDWSQDQIMHAINLYKERVSTLVELRNQILALYQMPDNYDAQAVQRWLTKESADYLRELLKQLVTLKEWDAGQIEGVIKEFVKQRKIKLASVAQLVRIALTSNSVSPGIFNLLSILGKEESINRLEAFLKQCDK